MSKVSQCVKGVSPECWGSSGKALFSTLLCLVLLMMVRRLVGGGKNDKSNVFVVLDIIDIAVEVELHDISKNDIAIFLFPGMYYILKGLLLHSVQLMWSNILMTLLYMY